MSSHPGITVLILAAVVADGGTRAYEFRASQFDHSSLRLTGRGADRLIHPGPSGLEVRVPALPRRLRGFGVSTPFGLSGDFAVTADYHIRAWGQPDLDCDLGVLLRLVNEDRDGTTLEFGRRRRQREGEVYVVTVMTHEEGSGQKKSVKYYPAKSISGRLRIAREKTHLRFLASEGSEGPFHEIAQADVHASAFHAAEFGFDACRRGAIQGELTHLELKATTFVDIPETTHSSGVGWKTISGGIFLATGAWVLWSRLKPG